jgi:hypothetical protein
MTTTVWKPRFFRSGLVLPAIIAAVVATPAVAGAQKAATGPGQVTFTKDVAPILYRSCVRCHRPDEIAPMSLMTYNDARPWARSMKERVSKREMPPWFIDKTIGIQKYKDDPSLSDSEIATIVKWVDAGAPQGNPADMPLRPKLEDVSAWRIGTPDLIVQYPAYKMPATGPDLYGTLDTPFGTTEDRYIKAIQSRVIDGASRKVVHHALSYAISPDETAEAGDDSGGGGGQFLVEYASGKNATIYQPDAGLLLPAGQNARVSYHFHSIGEAVNAKIELGVVLYPKGFVPKHIQWSKQLGMDTDGNASIDIPSNSIVRRDGYTRLNVAARLTAWQPHMHIRGKYQCLELIYPGEPVKTETVSCANWNYNWHTIYNYEDDVAPIVPAGTLLHVITWFDNTPANKFNPDPKNWVGAGTGRTIDEMGFSWIGWYDLSNEEYKAELAARKAAQQPRITTGQQ